MLLFVISVFDPGLPDLGTLNPCLWPRLLPGIVYVSALPLIFLFLPADVWFCLLNILLHLNPHAFDQSLQKTSPKMNPAVRMLLLRQGTRSIEEYVAYFLELAPLTQLDEICLMIFFRGGLSEPLGSIMPLHEATWTLEEYSDLALKLSGSPFTVGVAEEENHSLIGTSTAETCHKMAADPEPHNSPAKPESALIIPAKPEFALARPAKPESPARMATTPAIAPLWPRLITSVLDPPLVSVRAAGIPRPAPSQELAESAPEPAPSQELAESAPEPAPSQELAESAPEPAPSQELAESAPEPAPSQELAESAPEPAPSQELAESAPEPAPSQELTESAPQPVPPSTPSSPLVPPSSHSSPLVPPSSHSSPLVPPSSPSPRVLSSLALSECPRDPAPPECPLEVVEFTKNFLGGSFPPLLTETPNPPWPMESPDSSWLPEALDLPWPPKLPASVLETICALSASCVSVSSRSQSLPGVSSAPPWWAPVSSAPPWWVPDLPESPHASADLPESPHTSADLPESPHAYADLPESPHASADLPESPHASADLPESPHASADLPESPLLTCQSHLTPPLTCQNHLTPPLSRPPCPGGFLSHLPHMDLALRSHPWFHLRSTTLLDCALCEASGSRSLGGGHYSVITLVATLYISCTRLQLHITYGLHLTHSRPPLHQSHSCHQSLISLDCLTTPAPHSHTHTFKQHSYMHSPRSLVLAPADISERYSSCYLLSLCLTPDFPTLELWTRACDPDFCLVLFTSLPCLW